MEETPVKRSHSEVESDSSPEFLEPKRLNRSFNMEALQAAMHDIQSQVGQINELTKVCHQTQSTVQTIQNTLDDLVGQVKELQDRCNKTERELNVCKQECMAVKYENTVMKNKIKQLEERAITAESYSRRDNLIIDGIQESPNEDLVEKVKDVLRIDMKCDKDMVNDMKFTRVHRLKNRRKTIVKFHYYQDKDYVWKHKYALKNTKKYWLEEDYPVEIKNRRQVLEPIFRAAKKIPDLKCSMVADKLIINGQRYTTSTLHRLPDPLKLHNTSVATQGDVVYFFTRASPFSNFFPALFKLNGSTYSCVEQYYQARKAAECGDYQAEMDIMMCDDPAQMFAIGHQVKTDANKWTEGKRLSVMREALLAKFTQNDYLRDVLLSTSGKTLVECAPRDTFWGIGVGLKQAMKTPSVQWPGRNELGKVIMETREKLSS